MKKVILLVIVVAALIAAFFGWKLYRPAVHVTDSEYLYILPGDDVNAVREKLVAAKMVNASSYDLAAKLFKYKNAKSGRYKLENGASAVSLIKMLRSGNQSPVKMVVIKERTPQLFAAKFGKDRRYDFAFDSLAMINALTNPEILTKYKVDSNTVMALVMPYTYELNWSSTPEQVIERMNDAYQRFWTTERKTKADSLHFTPLQVMTIASIVEEETNKKEDKFKIASVYLNRLRLGMPLQADPTVKFATKNFALKRITGEHLRIQSPYNTYLNKGIPPGPICTPEISSIEAVLNAPHTDYIYFVASSKFDGTSNFAINYNEHLKFAREYQQELTRRMDSSRKANAGK